MKIFLARILNTLKLLYYYHSVNNCSAGHSYWCNYCFYIGMFIPLFIFYAREILFQLVWLIAHHIDTLFTQLSMFFVETSTVDRKYSMWLNKTFINHTFCRLGSFKYRGADISFQSHSTVHFAILDFDIALKGSLFRLHF